MQDDSHSPQSETVSAGGLPAWTVGELPKPPKLGWRSWAALIGPGVLIAGSSIGSGEWLAGPGVTAQYGGTLLWVATLSIVGQVFCNLEFMRYALYCGEPILVGGFGVTFLSVVGRGAEPSLVTVILLYGSTSWRFLGKVWFI